MLNAGSISFQQSITVRYKGDLTQFELNMTHIGDESVNDVRAVLIFHQKEILLGGTKRLHPNEKVTFTSVFQKLNGFETPGKVIVPVILYWKDSALQSYETLSTHLVKNDTKDGSQRFLIDPVELDLTMSGRQSDQEISVKNLTSEALELKCIPMTASGMSIKVDEPSFQLAANEKKQIKYTILNPNKSDGIYSLALAFEAGNSQWVETQAQKIVLRVSPVSNELPVIFTLRRTIMGLVVSILALLFLIWRPFKK